MSMICQLLLLCAALARCSFAEEASDASIYRINSPGTSKNVTLGGNVKFTCGIEYQPGGSLALLWYRGSEMVALNDNILRKRPGKAYRIYKDGMELEILNVQRDDEGDYICSVTHTPPFNQTHHLTVFHLSSIELTPHPIKDVFVGERLILTCTGDGKPKPTVEWRINGKRPGHHVRMQADTGELIIDSVKKEDAGNYECTLSNHAGMRSEATGVNVFGSLMVRTDPPNGNASVKEGEEITLGCQVDAVGNIIPSWHFENVPIGKENKGIELTVSNAQKKHQGKYECRYSIGLSSGSIAGKFYLTVLSPGEQGSMVTDPHSKVVDEHRKDEEAAAIEQMTTVKPNDGSTSKSQLQLISILTVVILSIFFW